MGLGRYPATGPALARGIAVGLGADTVAYGPTDLFSEMRLALAAERSRSNGPVLAQPLQLLPAVVSIITETLHLRGISSTCRAAS